MSVERAGPTHAISEYVDLGEVLKAADETGNQGKKQVRTDKRDGNVPKARPPRRAIHQGSVIKLLRHILQPGQQDDHQTAHAPGAHDDERRFGPLRAGQPAGARDADEAQQIIQHAILWVKDIGPDDCRGDSGNDTRQIEDRSIDGHPFYFDVEQKGQAQTDEDAYGNGKDDEIGRLYRESQKF